MSEQRSTNSSVVLLPSSETTIQGRGVMAALVRAFDWSKTPLGTLDAWSETLVSYVNLILLSPDPAILAWGDGLTMFYNDAVIPTLSDKHPRALGRSYRDVFSDAWPQVKDEVEGCLYRAETPVRENILVPLMRDGRLQNDYFAYSFLPVYENGRIAGVYNAFRDTTAAVVSAMELKASEAQAGRVLESIADAVIVTDLETRITRMNRVAEKLTGWLEKDVAGQQLASVFEVLDEENGHPIENPAAKVLRSGQIAGTSHRTLLVTRDGRSVAIDDRGAPIRDEQGHLTGVVLVFRDVEERRALEQQREAALKQAQETSERLQFTIQSVALGMWTYDPATNVVVADEEMHRIFGSPDRDGEVDYWLALLHPEDRQRVGEHFAGALACKHPYELEYRILRNGEVRWLRSKGKVVGSAGNPERMFAIVEDITDRKQAEAALQQTEKLAAVGRLASSISHEINNPLEAMTNLLYLAKGSNTLAEAQSFVETAERELRRVSLIANQTLKFHKQSTKPIPAFCYDLIGDSLSIYQARLINNRIEVEKRKRAEHPVKCFDSEVRQVLSNLIGNAIDAMPTGGRLLVRSREAQNWRTGARGIVLTVADTGTGMSPEVRKRIFDAFYTTKGIGGTGLGLWVSCEIVGRHHGSLKVRSSQAHGKSGTVFTLFLPFEAVERE